MTDPALGDDIKKHLTDAEVRLTGKRYCTTCNRLQHADGGTWRGSARGKRWICGACVYRTAKRIAPERP